MAGLSVGSKYGYWHGELDGGYLELNSADETPNKPIPQPPSPTPFPLPGPLKSSPSDNDSDSKSNTGRILWAIGDYSTESTAGIRQTTLQGYIAGRVCRAQL